MDLLEQHLESIEKYVDGKMTEVEQREFEKQMAQSPELQREVNNFMMIYQSIKKQSRREIKHELEILDEEQEKSFKRPVFSWRFLSAIAASALILITVGYLVFNPKKTSENIYNQFYTTYPNLVSSIQRGADSEDPKAQAFSFYENKKFTIAEKHFRQLLNNEPKAPDLNLYAGLTELELDHPDQALDFFNVVIENPPNQYIQQALWYAALASLKQNNRQKTRAFANQLLGIKGFYAVKAQQLLSALDAL